MNRQLNPYRSDVRSIKYRVSDVNIITRDNEYLNDSGVKTLPHFKYARGDFACYHHQLTSLKGCPIYVGGDFTCSNMKLTSLKGCPIYVGRDFDCDNNQLTSLKYCPIYVGGSLNYFHNYITSSEGVTISGEFINE